MSDPKKATPVEPPADPPTEEPSGPLTMGDIRKLIADTVKEVVGGSSGQEDGKKAPTAEEPTDTGITAQVAKALENIRKREERDNRDKNIDTQLAELQQTIAQKTQEKTPMEKSRAHRWMKWGDNE